MWHYNFHTLIFLYQPLLAICIYTEQKEKLVKYYFLSFLKLLNKQDGRVSNSWTDAKTCFAAWLNEAIFGNYRMARQVDLTLLRCHMSWFSRAL